MYIVIVGCGRLGSFLANKLSQAGHNIIVIDHSESAFSLLSSGFSGFKIEGDAIELAVLKKSKIEKADVLLAVSENDNTNLMVAQIAINIFKVPNVIARIFDHEKEEIYRQSGIEIICTTTVLGDIFLDEIFTKRSTRS